MTGPEAERTLELVHAAERAVVRLLLALGVPGKFIGSASYYAVSTAMKLDVVWRLVESRIGPQPESPFVQEMAAGLRNREWTADVEAATRLRNAVDRAVDVILEAKGAQNA